MPSSAGALPLPNARLLAWSADTPLKLACVDASGLLTVFENPPLAKASDFSLLGLPRNQGWSDSRSLSFYGTPLSISFRPYSSDCDIAICCSRGVVVISRRGCERFIATPGSPSAMAWHPRGRLLALTVGQQLLVADAAAPDEALVVAGRVDKASASLSWSATGGLAVGGGRRLRIYDAGWDYEVWSPGGRVSAWTLDGKTVFCASRAAGLFRVQFPSKAAVCVVSAKDLDILMQECGGGGAGDDVADVAVDPQGLRVALRFSQGTQGVALVSVLIKRATVLKVDSPPVAAAFAQSHPLLAVATLDGVVLDSIVQC